MSCLPSLELTYCFRLLKSYRAWAEKTKFTRTQLRKNIALTFAVLYRKLFTSTINISCAKYESGGPWISSNLFSGESAASLIMLILYAFTYELEDGALGVIPTRWSGDFVEVAESW